MTKEELRRTYLNKRTLLSDSEYAALNEQLCDVFFQNVELKRIQTVHTFLPIKKSKEPDTWAIVNRLKAEHPLLRISIPRVNTKTSQIESIVLDTTGNLTESKWGIPEPTEGILVKPAEIDLVLVPMLIFDTKGHRVGYGKGFYDKFLPTLRVDCKRIGLCLFDPVDEIDNINAYDIPIHECITPYRSYRF